MLEKNELKRKFTNLMKTVYAEDRIVYFYIGNIYKYAYENKLIHCNNYSTFENNYARFDDSDLLRFADEMNHKLLFHDNKALKVLYEYFDLLNIDDLRELVYMLLSGEINASKTFTESSSNSICELVSDLLEIKDGDSVIDFCSGLGNFLANVYKKSCDEKYALKDLIGIEINIEQAQLSIMALSVLTDGVIKPHIFAGNALLKVQYPYTHAFVFPSLGMRNILEENYRKSFVFPETYLTNRNSAEWLFIDSMLSGLHGGRGVALVSGRALFNNSDLEYRNELVASGLLEGIIELPIGSLSFTGVKMFMLVFSEGNKYIKFVDASNVIGTENKRYINLELPVKAIENMYYSKDVATKSIEELVDAPNLFPSKILLNLRKVENGVRLKDIADVFTGNQYTLSVFESKQLITDEITWYRILTSGDIEDNVVRWDSLRHVIIKDNKFDKFAVHYGDVIVTSKSSKVKVGVVNIESKEKILVTGGMIIVRPQLDKLNPTYLKMLLDSEMGKDALKSIQKGISFITSITASGLSSIEIPLIDIWKQEEKVERYNKYLSTLIAYKQEIKRIENSLKNIFEED